jgi:CheY-like chemotaxis protein
VEERPERVDSFDAIRQIRGRGEIASLPIIAVTAFDRADSRDGATLAGCDHFLSKPIDFNRLEVLVEKLTRAARDGDD